MLEFFFEDIDEFDLNIKNISDWLNKVAKFHKKKIDNLSIIFCSDEYILTVNNSYLNHDYYTDIITFDYCEGNILSGDLFISIDTVTSNTIKFDTTFAQELNRVMVHGLLHLVGFKDSTAKEKKIMTDQEDLALKLKETFS